MEVAEKFTVAMQRRNLNQSEAARDLGVTRQAFSQYLLQKSTPQGEILARACAKWNITLTYREKQFGSSAFGAREAKTEPEVLQLDLFKEPQVFENANLVVTVERSHKATLQFTIKMKKASIPQAPRDARKSSYRSS